MYYPYGTMETLLKPPVNDNAREKFTGKELDAGDNPVSEVSFNIAINNFDAGMHYHGELYVNYTDLVYNRSFLKVYPLQYYTDADRFILNTADRFPDSMRVTNLRISTSGAVSPINYDKACDYTVITDSGLVIALDTSGSALINSSSVNYFTDSTYTPERVAGSNLYYFGARYYDAELGVWGSTDPLEQFWNTYGYHTNPVRYVDPQGKSFWSFARWLFPVTQSVLSIASATNAAVSQNNFGRGLVAFFSDIGMNEGFNTIGPLFEGINITANFFTNWGSDKWATTFKSIWDNEISSLQNAFNSENFVDFASGINQSGFNSFSTSINNFHYQWHSNQKYYGRVEDTHGFSAVVWGRPGEGKNNASTLGNNVILEKPFYNNLPSSTSDEYIAGSGQSFVASQEATFRHEFIHVRQSSWYGQGGFLLKTTYGKYRNDYSPGTFGYEAIDKYGDSPGWIDVLEFEAQSHEHRGRSDKYWFDVYNQIKF